MRDQSRDRRDGPGGIGATPLRSRGADVRPATGAEDSDRRGRFWSGPVDGPCPVGSSWLESIPGLAGKVDPVSSLLSTVESSSGRSTKWITKRLRRIVLQQRRLAESQNKGLDSLDKAAAVSSRRGAKVEGAINRFRS
jgi:hypothetical protein